MMLHVSGVPAPVRELREEQEAYRKKRVLEKGDNRQQQVLMIVVQEISDGNPGVQLSE